MATIWPNFSCFLKILWLISLLWAFFNVMIIFRDQFFKTNYQLFEINFFLFRALQILSSKRPETLGGPSKSVLRTRLHASDIDFLNPREAAACR